MAVEPELRSCGGGGADKVAPCSRPSRQASVHQWLSLELKLFRIAGCNAGFPVARNRTGKFHDQQTGMSALRRRLPANQQLFNLCMDHFPRLLPVAVLHEEFVVARVFVPDVRNDRQPQGLRLEIFRRRRAADAA